MVLYFRDLSLFYLDLLELSEEELSEEEIQEIRDGLDKYNELLQLDYSLKNLQRLREFKEEEDNDYQEFLNDEELQNDLWEWRRTKRRRSRSERERVFSCRGGNGFKIPPYPLKRMSLK